MIVGIPNISSIRLISDIEYSNHIINTAPSNSEYLSVESDIQISSMRSVTSRNGDGTGFDRDLPWLATIRGGLGSGSLKFGVCMDIWAYI